VLSAQPSCVKCKLDGGKDSFDFVLSLAALLLLVCYTVKMSKYLLFLPFNTFKDICGDVILA